MASPTYRKVRRTFRIPESGDAKLLTIHELEDNSFRFMVNDLTEVGYMTYFEALHLASWIQDAPGRPKDVKK